MWAVFINESGTWLRGLYSGAKVENDTLEFLMITTAFPAFTPLCALSSVCWPYICS